MPQQTVEAVLEDWRTAPIDSKLKATLAYVEKLTLSPHDLTTIDIDALRSEGVSDKGIEEAAYVTYLFSVMDRLADTFDFDIPTSEHVGKTGQFLFKNGYKLVKLIR